MRMLLATLVFLICFRDAISQQAPRAPDTRLKETIVQKRESELDNWENSLRHQYTYDERGNVIGYKQYIWILNDPNTQPYRFQNWTLVTEIEERFNSRNRPIWSYERYYDDYSMLLTSEFTRESTYRGDSLLTEKISEWKNHENGRQSNSWMYYEYDPLGRMIERKSIQTDSEGLRVGLGLRTYYDGNGCASSFVSLRLSEDASFQDFNMAVSDSTAIVSDSNCNYVQEDRFTFLQGAFTLESQRQYENEYDQNGSLIRRVSLFRESPDEAYETTSELEIGNEGNLERSVLLQYEINTETITEIERDNEGRQLLYSFMEKNLDSAEYSINYSVRNTYNEFGLLTRSSQGFFREFSFDEVLNLMYDEEGNLESRSFISSAQNGFTGETFFTDNWNQYSHRCDGEVSSYLGRYQSETDVSSEIVFESVSHTFWRVAGCDPSRITAQEVTLFPNPAQAFFHIYNEQAIGPANVTITDSQGNILQSFQQDLTNFQSIDIRGLRPGAYLITIRTKNRTFVKRFLKN